MDERMANPGPRDKCTREIIFTCDTCGKSTFRHGPLHDGKLCAKCAATSGKRSQTVSMLLEPQNFPQNAPAGKYLRRKKHRTQDTTAPSARASSSRANVIGTTRALDEQLQNENLPSDRGAKGVPTFCSRRSTASHTATPASNTVILGEGGRFSQRSIRTTAPAAIRDLARSCDVGIQCTDLLPRASPDLLTHSVVLSPIVVRFWDLAREHSISFQQAAGNVRAACAAAYGEQIAASDSFMQAALGDGLIPYQPQTTPSRAIGAFQRTIADQVERLGHFASCIPVFCDFPEEDQRIIIVEKFVVCNMVCAHKIHISRYFYKGDRYYCMLGEDNVHCCKYWIDVLGFDPDFVHFNDFYYAAVNDIGLNHIERYLLLAAALFASDVTQVSSSTKRSMECCYAYFLSVLYYLLGHRISAEERDTVFKKLEKVIRLFPVIDKLSMKYVSNVNASALPLRPRISQSFKDCLPRNFQDS